MLRTNITARIAGGASLKLGARGDVVAAVQAALRDAGHEVIPDGDFGKITDAAVRRFQAAHKLLADGEVGPLTAAALDKVPVSDQPTAPLQSAVTEAPWLSIARALTGTAEIPGARSNPLILKWRDEIIAAFPDLKPNLNWFVNDDTPWCGLFTAYCVAMAGFKPPVAPLLATNWFRAWPDGIRLRDPVPGAILVKTRAGGGHVTFVEGQTSSVYWGRGGNQSNRVNVAPVKKNNEVLGFMWPKGVPVIGGSLPHMSFAGAIVGTEA